MATPLTPGDKFLLLGAVGDPDTRDRIATLLDLAGTGDVTGPGSSTDNALVRFDGAGGALIQNSTVLVTDAGNMSGVGSLSASSANLSGLTAGRALATDGSKNLTSSATTATELGYLSGVSSAIQTQLDGKVNDTSDTMTGVLTVNGGISLGEFAGEQVFPHGIQGYTPGSNTLLWYGGASVGDLNFKSGASGGAGDRFSFTQAGAFKTLGGTNALPSHSFINDPDTGIYSQAANSLGMSAGGVNQAILDSTGTMYLRSGVRAEAGVAGSASIPSYSFDGDNNTGMYNEAADQLSFSTGGTRALKVTSSFVFSDSVFLATTGGNTAPTYTFESDTNTGMYRDSADALAFTTGGTRQLLCNNTLVSFRNKIQSESNGVAGAPAYTFEADTGIGIYNGTGGALGISSSSSAPDAQVGTLNNLPTATAGGDPDVFLQIKVGSTVYVFPGWAI